MATITGIRSVAEITQMFQPKLTIKVRSDLQQKRKPNITWMTSIISSCKELSAVPSMKGLNETVKCFLRHLQDAIKLSLKNPKRSQKLKLHVQTFLTYCYSIYRRIKKPLDSAQYKERIGDIMAMYIDLELKSSRICKNGLKSMISWRICSYLFLCLDKSLEHILDAIFKSTKFFIKIYNDICSAVMKRVLHDNSFDDYDTNYVRYLLAYKLWMKIAGKEHHSTIKREAIIKLIPPSDFPDKLKSGKFSNILPYLPKPDRHRATTFYVQSQFDLKDKIQAFLKHFKSKEGAEDQDDSVIVLYQSDYSCAVSNDDIDKNLHSIDKIWRKYNEEELCDDVLFTVTELEALLHGEEEDVLVQHKKDQQIESFNNISNGIETRFFNLSRKKFKSSPTNLPLGNYTNMDTEDLIMEGQTNASEVSKEERIFSHNSKFDENVHILLTGSPESGQYPKPCATIGPGQSKECTQLGDSTLTTPEPADSSGVCEKNKYILNHETLFDISESNVVEQEIIIDSTSTFVDVSSFIVDNDDSEHIDPNVVIENDSLLTAQPSEVRYQQTKSSNNNNHQLPYLIPRRQDSYSDNDFKLSKLISCVFSDVNDNSDDDSRSHGDKLSAFKGQLEANSDSGEDLGSSSPSSYPTALDADFNNKPASCEGNAFDHDLKSPALSPIKDNRSASQHSSSHSFARKRSRRNSKSLEELAHSDDSEGDGTKTTEKVKRSSPRSTLKSKSKVEPKLIEPAPTEKEPTKKKTTAKKGRKRRR